MIPARCTASPLAAPQVQPGYALHVLLWNLPRPARTPEQRVQDIRMCLSTLHCAEGCCSTFVLHLRVVYQRAPLSSQAVEGAGGHAGVDPAAHPADELLRLPHPRTPRHVDSIEEDPGIAWVTLP